MTQGVHKAASLLGSTVKILFFASSACVYPQTLQSEKDVSLKESDVSVYGWWFYSQPARALIRLQLRAQYTQKFYIKI